MLPASIIRPRNYHRDKYQMEHAPPCFLDCFRSFGSCVFLEAMSFLNSLEFDRTALGKKRKRNISGDSYMRF